MERTSFPILVGCAIAVSIYILNVLPGFFSFLIGAAVASSGVAAVSIPSVNSITTKAWESITAGMSSSSSTSSPQQGRLTFGRQQQPLTLRDVQMKLRHAGLEKGSLIVGIDFTKSNLEQGYRTYHGKSLHALDLPNGQLNPYQAVISSVGETLAVFDDDNQIPAFGFGDKVTGDRIVFPLGEKPANGFAEVLQQYEAQARKVKMDGPTSFAPLIYQACEIVKEANYDFHILVIVTDGAVNDKNNATVEAIVHAASEFPLSIIAVGVGDGPWDEMKRFDDELPERKFDNFTFVNYEELKRTADANDVAFAEAALRETPGQFKFARENGMLSPPKARTSGRNPRVRRQD